MSLTVTWDADAQHTILVTLDPSWTWNDIYGMNPLTDALASSVDHKVCYLVDMSQTREVPIGFSPSRFKEAVSFDQPNSDLVVIVAPSLFVHTMINTIVKAVGRRDDMVFAESMDQARERIAARLRETTAS